MSDLGVHGARDPGAVLAPVPGGADRDEVFDWALGALPFRDGAVAEDGVDATFRDLRWVRVQRTRRFWADDLTAATRAACSMASGWARLGVPVGLVASMTGAGLDLQLGAPADHLAVVLGAVEANLPGIELGSPGPAPVGEGAHAGASSFLWAVPDEDADPRAASILDRLIELRGTRWRLEVLLVPLPATVLRPRAVALAHLGVELAAQRILQRQLDPRTTQTYEDPVVARLSDAVAVEHERVVHAIDVGCLGVLARLWAPNAGELGAALGAATAAAPSAGTRWRAGPLEGALPLALVAATDAADVVRPPARDVWGLPSERWGELDDHPEPPEGTGPSLVLGRTDRGAPIQLPFDRLNDHVLVTGGSGSGKSTHLVAILQQLGDAGTPYLVLEPVKDEYRRLPLPGLRWWAPGAPDPGQSWALNPLEVLDGTPVATHVDRLVALFRSCFALPDPLDHLVEIALGELYRANGWDLRSDRNLNDRRPRHELDWPTLSDLLEVCADLPARLGYDREVQGNLHAMFVARLGSLVRGPRGRTMDRSDPFPVEDAFGAPLVVNLDAIGDDHARSFVMGLLLVLLREVRGSSPCNDLVHVTVVEEAHRVMGTGPRATDPDRAARAGHTAEAFGDLLAEIRATGEGLIVVEQSPSRLVRSAMVNTGTKVALRSTDRDDQAALAASMGLHADDAEVLATLRRHEALVTWAGMDRPVRVNLEAALLARRPLPPSTASRRPLEPDRVPDAVRAAAALLLITEPRDERRARRALLDAICDQWPGASAADVEDLFRAIIGTEVAALARSRRWSRATRLAAVDAAVGRQDGPAHPRHLLALGRQPYGACAAACPRGGCLTAELLAPQASVILGEGPATLARLVQDPEERRRRLRRRVAAAVADDAPADLQEHGLRCLTVQVFDHWVDRETVTALLPPGAVDR